MTNRLNMDLEMNELIDPNSPKRILYIKPYMPLFVCPPIKFTRWERIKSWFRVHVQRKPHRFARYTKRIINPNYYVTGTIVGEDTSMEDNVPELYPEQLLTPK